MAQKSTRIFTAVKNMVWAKVASVVMAVVASLTAYYWKELTGTADRPVAGGPHRHFPHKQFVPQQPGFPHQPGFPQQTPTQQPFPSPSLPPSQVIPGPGMPTGPLPGMPPGPIVAGKLTNLPRPTTCDILNCDVVLRGNNVMVAIVRPGSVGAMLGLVPGDIIEAVDQHAIDSAAKLETSLAHSRYFFSTIVRVRRGNATLTGEVHLRSDNRLEVRRPLGA